MATFSKPHSAVNHRLLFIFIVAWLAINLLQAALVNIDPDEAYYWWYSQKPAWGYFDHPPLVALTIALGETFGHGPLYTRLGAVLLSAGTVYFGFKALPRYLADVQLYLLLFCSAVLFHVYAFITTPDAVLLFFTAAFFYTYRNYLEEETGTHTLLVALSITGLLYSKYHGILPVFFTLLSNPALFKKASAWLIVVVFFVLFSPHLWWQYNHDWPTLRYHLSERIASPYAVRKTIYYIAGQLFIWGPFTTIPALVLFLKTHWVYSRYERAHLFTFWGVLLFFLISSFRSTIEPHWTLVAGASFLVLLMGVLHRSSLKINKQFRILSLITCVLMLVGRVLFTIPAAPVKAIDAFNDLVDAPTWTTSLYRFTKGLPVVFVNSYRLPALYQYYYPEAKTFGYNTVGYRKTQFNLYSDAFLNKKPVYIAGTNSLPGSTNFLNTPYDTFCIQRLPSYKAVCHLQLAWLQPVKTFRKTKKNTVMLLLCNTGKDTIAATGLALNYTFLKTRSEQFSPQAMLPLQEPFVPPSHQKKIYLDVELPNEKGTYALVFSMIQPPLAGTFASPLYKVLVE